MKFFDRLKARLKFRSETGRYIHETKTAPKDVANDTRRQLAKMLFAAAAVGGTALTAAQDSLAATALSIRPPMTGSSVAGQRPGDGTFAALLPGGTFLNDADGFLGWCDSSGSFHGVNLNDLKSPFFYGYGAPGSTITTNTAAVQQWLNNGGRVLPVGTFQVNATLVGVSNQRIRGFGQSSIIQLVLPAGSPAIPVLIYPAGTTDVTIEDMVFDGNSSGLVTPTLDAVQPAWGSVLIVGAANARLRNLTVINGWDNCIFIESMVYPFTTLGSTTYGPGGSPQYVFIENCITQNAGLGNHTAALKGHSGTGINVGSASYTTVRGCVDISSYSAFGTDTGGNAVFVSFIDCKSYLCQYDKNNPTNGSGNAFVLQASNGQIVGCQAHAPGYRGYWVSAGNTPLTSFQLTNCYCELAGGCGYDIDSANGTLTGCECYDSGQLNTAGSTTAGLFSNFSLNANFSAITHCILMGCYGRTDDNKAAYSYAENNSPTPSNVSQQSVSAQVIGGSYAGGSLGNTSYGSATTFFAGLDPFVQIDSGNNIAFGGSLTSYVAFIVGGARNAGVWLQGGTNSALVKANSYAGGAADLQLSGTGTGAVNPLGAVKMTGIPTASTGLAAGSVWRDNSTTPPTLRIV